MTEFAEYSAESTRIWNANAEWWDDRIGDGNSTQTQLIEPYTEKQLAVGEGDRILDIACGAGRFARRMAELGASVVAFDHSEAFVERARQKTDSPRVEYHVVDTCDAAAMEDLGCDFDKAVCTMALMDMPHIEPLFSILPKLLKPGGTFVFSTMHPSFHTPNGQRVIEQFDDEAGRLRTRYGLKTFTYNTPMAWKSEGVVGQPESQYYFHRPLHQLLRPAFENGFVVTGLEEPVFSPTERSRTTAAWADREEIPFIMVVKLVLAG